MGQKSSGTGRLSGSMGSGGRLPCAGIDKLCDGTFSGNDHSRRRCHASGAIRNKLITYINGYVITEELEVLEHYVVPASLHDDQGIMGCLELARRALEG